MVYLADRDGRMVVGVAARGVIVGDYTCQHAHDSAIVARLDLFQSHCDVGVQSFQQNYHIRLSLLYCILAETQTSGMNA
jgi:hypothetical protein